MKPYGKGPDRNKYPHPDPPEDWPKSRKWPTGGGGRGK